MDDIEKSYLDKIKEIGMHLVDFKKESSNPNLPGYDVEYSVRPGKCLAKGLMKIGSVAVVDIILEPGAYVVDHIHEVREYGLVYEGSISVTVCGETKEYNVGDIIYLQPQTVHFTKSENGARAIYITIPADEGYPDARN